MAAGDTSAGGWQRSGAASARRRLPRTLALELGGGAFLPLVCAGSCVPLHRKIPLQVEPPAAGQRLVLRLVEMPPPPPADDVSPPDGPPQPPRAVAALALHACDNAPGESGLVVSVDVTAEGACRIEAVAAAAARSDDEQAATDGAAQSLGSLSVPAPEAVAA